MKPTIIIPVKAKSDRLPGKNFIDLGGHPLYEWTFQEMAILAPDYDVFVVSDLLGVQDAADRYGLMVISRKQWWDDLTAWGLALAATDAEVIALCLVTSPFRSWHHVQDAIRLYELDTKPVISAVSMPMKQVLCVDDLHELTCGVTNYTKTFRSTGVVQIAARDDIKDGHINRDRPFHIYEVDQVVGHDIDTPFDMAAARAHVSINHATEESTQ